MKKKIQNALILFIIIIAAAIFCSSLNLIFSINKTFSETHHKLNGFDNIIYINPHKENSNNIIKLFKQDKATKEVEVADNYSVNQYAKANGKQLKQTYFIQEKKNKNIGIDKLMVLEGDKGVSPKPGEIWMSKDVANDNGIKLNDYIQFNIEGKRIAKRVGALVVDPGIGKASIGICRFWIGKGELKKIVPKEDIIKVVSVVFKKCGDGNDVNLKIEKKLGRPIIGYSFQYSIVKSGSTIAFNVIGGVLFAIAIFILIFTFVIVIITIVNSIFSDYKNIGIISTLGFTHVQIMMNYIVQFLIISIIGSIAGIAVGSILSSRLLQEFYNSLGFADVNIPIRYTGLITFAVFVVFIGISSLIASMSTFNISPVEAIRQGSASVKEKGGNGLSIVSMKKLNLYFSLAIKNILGNKRQNLLLLFAISSAVYISAFCINTRQAVNTADQNSIYWGFQKSDISLLARSNISSKSILKDVNTIAKDKRIKIISNQYSYTSILVPKTDKLPSESLYTIVYDKDFDKIGLDNIKGRNPKDSDEISISDKLSDKYKKGIGDYFNIYVNGVKKQFLITGVFQSVVHFGEGIRIKSSSINSVDSRFKTEAPLQSTIILKDKNQIAGVLHDLQAKYGENYKIEKGNQVLVKMLKSNFSPANVALALVTISFMIIAVFCIFNLNLIIIYSYKKDLGIYKALGFKDGEIIKIYIYKLLLLIVVSIIIIIPIEVKTQSPVLGVVLANIGLRNLPLPIYFEQVIGFVVIFTILIILAVLISCRAIVDINGRELIDE